MSQPHKLNPFDSLKATSSPIIQPSDPLNASVVPTGSPQGAIAGAPVKSRYQPPPSLSRDLSAEFRDLTEDSFSEPAVDPIAKAPKEFDRDLVLDARTRLSQKELMDNKSKVKAQDTAATANTPNSSAKAANKVKREQDAAGFRAASKEIDEANRHKKEIARQKAALSKTLAAKAAKKEAGKGEKEKNPSTGGAGGDDSSNPPPQPPSGNMSVTDDDGQPENRTRPIAASTQALVHIYEGSADDLPFWFDEIESEAGKNGWSDQQMVAIAQSRVSKSVKRWIRQWAAWGTSVDDFEDLKALYTKTFVGTTGDRSWFLDCLRGLQMRKDEDVMQFSARIQAALGEFWEDCNVDPKDRTNDMWLERLHMFFLDLGTFSEWQSSLCTPVG